VPEIGAELQRVRNREETCFSSSARLRSDVEAVEDAIVDRNQTVLQRGEDPLGYARKGGPCLNAASSIPVVRGPRMRIWFAMATVVITVVAACGRQNGTGSGTPNPDVHDAMARG
jgi:hypothetical protein